MMLKIPLTLKILSVLKQAPGSQLSVPSIQGIIEKVYGEYPNDTLVWADITKLANAELVAIAHGAKWSYVKLTEQGLDKLELIQQRIAQMGEI